MKERESDAGYMPERDKKNNIRVAIWAIAYGVTIVFMDIAQQYLWYTSVLSVLAICINTLIGVGVFVAYKRLFSEMDELQQKIHIDALALTAAVGIIGGMCLDQVHEAGFIALTVADATTIVVMMIITYAAATIFSKMRYS